MDSILRKNFTYLFLIQNINYIIPLLLLPYLTRILGAENFGKITFAQAFVTYFVLITDFGFNTSSTQEIVRVRHDKLALSKIFWSTTAAKLLFALLSFVVFSALVLTVPKLQQLNILLLISFAGVFSTILFPVWLFQGLEKMAYITWFNAVPRILILVFTFVFVKQKTDFQLALSIQVIGTLLAAVACTIFIFSQRLVQFYLPSLADIRTAIKEGWHIFASGMATNIYTTTNTVVLGFLATDAAVGIFAASEKIIRAIISLFSSVSQVTFPRINTYYKDSKELALNFGSKILIYTLFATFAVGLSLLIFAPLIVKLLFGLPQYAETITILRISSFIPLFSVCNGILAVNVLITFGLKRHLLRIVGAGGIFSLLLIFPAVWYHQAEGVAVVALLTEVVITVMLLRTFHRHNIKLKFN